MRMKPRDLAGRQSAKALQEFGAPQLYASFDCEQSVFIRDDLCYCPSVALETLRI